MYRFFLNYRYCIKRSIFFFRFYLFNFEQPSRCNFMFVQNKISVGRLKLNLGQMSAVPVGYYLTFHLIPLVGFYLSDGSPWNLDQTFMVPRGCLRKTIHLVLSSGFSEISWHVCGWVVIKFGSDIHDPIRRYCNKLHGPFGAIMRSKRPPDLMTLSSASVVLQIQCLN